MAREKRQPLAGTQRGPKDRHRKTKRHFDKYAPVPQGFVAKSAVPQLKHQTILEFVPNKEKKKKLEVEVEARGVKQSLC
jgi:hypothetical protein